MEPNENRFFQEDVHVADPSSNVNGTLKRPSKSRSRVWEKVVWFTRRAKGGKDSKGAGASAAELLKSNTSSGSDFVRDPRALEVEKSSGRHKIRKNRSIKYLKRRKVRQFGDDLCSGVVETEVSVQECGTATGTFHDFSSERRISRLDRTSSNNSLLNEIAKGMNRSPLKAKENVKSVLSLPLHDLSLNEGRIPDNITSPTFPPVRRSVSFSGPAYNSWPRKKRTHLENSSNVHLLSPPLKQKRVTSLRKGASFSGFDSSRVHLKNSSLPQYRNVKSTPHLTPIAQGGHIKNQNGSTIGAIHFYKSPVLYQEEAAVKNFQPKMQEKVTYDNSFSKCSTPHSSMFKSDLKRDGAVSIPLPRGSDIITQHPDTIVNPNHEMLAKHVDESNLVHNEHGCSQVPNSSNNLISFTVRSSEGQNPTISAFLLEGECSSSCLTSSPVYSSEEDLEKEKLLLPCISSEFTTQVDSTNQDIDGVEKNACDNTLKEYNGHENVFTSLDGNKAMDIQEYDAKVHGLKAVEQDSVSSTVTEYNSLSSVVSDVISSNSRTETTAHCDAQKCSALPSRRLSLVDEIRTVEIRTSLGHHGHGQTLWTGNQVIWQRKPTINGAQFKKCSEDILQWFREFNDEQKNILIRKLLEECELPQMHMLSVAMEPVLHKSCPPNCQDMLAWLPHHVALHILSFLDLVSLCHCSQVNHTWNNLASNPLLWQSLCGCPGWQLSRIGEEKEKKKYTMDDGTIQWKKMFASRYLLHQNWLKGKCNVRTFEGHTQGISCVQFDDTRIASGSYDKTIRVWDIQSGECDVVLTLAGHSGTVRCLNLNGNRLVSGSVDRSIKVWDLSFKSYWSGASCKVTMVGHMHTVRCLQVDDEKVVSGSYDKTLKVWDIRTGNCQLTLRGHNAAVLCVQFDDRKIVSGSYDKTIKVWSLTEGSCLMTLTGHHDAVTCLNLTFDSRKVISGSLDHNLKFWDLLTGKCIGTLDWIRSEGHTGVIRCLQTDSWRIVSAGDDKTLKMWSLESGQRLLTLRCHTDGVTCLQFNDYSIVSGSYDKTVKLWDFTPSHEFLTPG
ncbi:F-box/WD repeat-containing protein 7-like [Stylophora pistillata]|uniref:F-box/WD repeat-containing protein 7 n=1 Tax=Stylophora pistillata TaxID=50429 RepID=A0A2B4T030_STYPI|nr:F-box/WD repeat-containing protein 7-like [Stylophora pistillata]PFX34916.1 F-box/WD repeat-containing protein 7 [Stylophora pistillata]